MIDIYRQSKSYLGNINIKKHGVDEEWTTEKVIEYKRCSLDVKYFIKNYMKIISLDHGLVPFDLYDYQENMIDHFNDNRHSIVLSCRQSGKCLNKDTKIKIRNKKTGEEKEITMQEFHEMNK
jgi:hypothetical protein